MDFISIIFSPLNQLGELNLEFFWSIIMEYHKNLIKHQIDIPQ